MMPAPSKYRRRRTHATDLRVGAPMVGVRMQAGIVMGMELPIHIAPAVAEVDSSVPKMAARIHGQMVNARHQHPLQRRSIAPVNWRRTLAQMAIAFGLARDVKRVARVFVKMFKQRADGRTGMQTVHSSGSVARNIAPPRTMDARTLRRFSLVERGHFRGTRETWIGPNTRRRRIASGTQMCASLAQVAKIAGNRTEQISCGRN